MYSQELFKSMLQTEYTTRANIQLDDTDPCEGGIYDSDDEMDNTTAEGNEREDEVEEDEEEEEEEEGAPTLSEVFEDIMQSSQESTQTGNDIYEVERLIGKRVAFDGSYEYLVQWANYSGRSNSWVKKPDLVDCDELVQEYEAAISKGLMAVWHEEPVTHIGEGPCWLVPYGFRIPDKFCWVTINI